MKYYHIGEILETIKYNPPQDRIEVGDYIFLNCNGQWVDKEEYRELFKVIGYQFSEYYSLNRPEKFMVPDFICCDDCGLTFKYIFAKIIERKIK